MCSLWPSKDAHGPKPVAAGWLLRFTTARLVLLPSFDPAVWVSLLHCSFSFLLLAGGRGVAPPPPPSSRVNLLCCAFRGTCVLLHVVAASFPSGWSCPWRGVRPSGAGVLWLFLVFSHRSQWTPETRVKSPEISTF